MEYSVSPDGEKFKIPEEKDYVNEYDRLEKLVRLKKEEDYGGDENYC